MTMLRLDSDRWSDLSCAYGSATNVPELLMRLMQYPVADAEPFFSLCHQGDTFTAACAAVSHILALARAEPARITCDFLLLPTSIEIA